jgi:hypothetical protein
MPDSSIGGGAEQSAYLQPAEIADPTEIRKMDIGDSSVSVPPGNIDP